MHTEVRYESYDTIIIMFIHIQGSYQNLLRVVLGLDLIPSAITLSPLSPSPLFVKLIMNTKSKFWLHAIQKIGLTQVAPDFCCMVEIQLSVGTALFLLLPIQSCMHVHAKFGLHKLSACAFYAEFVVFIYMYLSSFRPRLTFNISHRCLNPLSSILLFPILHKPYIYVHQLEEAKSVALPTPHHHPPSCLLYTSDAADE